MGVAGGDHKGAVSTALVGPPEAPTGRQQISMVMEFWRARVSALPECSSFPFKPAGLRCAGAGRQLTTGTGLTADSAIDRDSEQGADDYPAPVGGGWDYGARRPRNGPEQDLFYAAPGGSHAPRQDPRFMVATWPIRQDVAGTPRSARHRRSIVRRPPELDCGGRPHASRWHPARSGRHTGELRTASLPAASTTTCRLAGRALPFHTRRLSERADPRRPTESGPEHNPHAALRILPQPYAARRARPFRVAPQGIPDDANCRKVVAKPQARIDTCGWTAACPSRRSPAFASR